MSTALLKLLEFNFSKQLRNHHVKLLDEIMYFLLSKIDPAGMKEAQFCWPIYDGKQSQEFKSVCLKVLDKLYTQGKIKTQFKKFNYDITKCEANIVELCVYLIKSRLKQNDGKNVDQLKQAVQQIIKDRSELQGKMDASNTMLHHEIQVLKDKLSSLTADKELDVDTRRVLSCERHDLSLKVSQELMLLESRMERMNKANASLMNLTENKYVLGRMDLVFSEGKAASQFQEYMNTENLEPFKDGKLDLVVFLKLYKLLLVEIINYFKSSENQVAAGAECFPQMVLELQELHKIVKESNSDLNTSLLKEHEFKEKCKSRLKDVYEIEKSESRQFIMNSSISISDGVVPLKIVQHQQLDPRIIESLESCIDSMIQDKRQTILPAKKSDILKKLARSILSSRKKPKETEDNIFDENCPSFLMNDDDVLIF